MDASFKDDNAVFAQQAYGLLLTHHHSHILTLYCCKSTHPLDDICRMDFIQHFVNLKELILNN